MTRLASIFAVLGLVTLGAWLHIKPHNQAPVPVVSTTTTSDINTSTDTEIHTNSVPATKTNTAQAPVSSNASSTSSSTTLVATEKSKVMQDGLATHYATFDVHSIPLGDGKVSTEPKVGYVYSCQTTFRGGGASHTGDWIGNNTWDLTKKLTVLGTVYWDTATFSNILSGVTRLITGNGLPVHEPTGIFPIAQSDPAYQIDRNPNSIKIQNVQYSLPADPVFAASASCVPMGAIGVALNGVSIYNALDDGGRDAVAHEVQDTCNGHPQQAGEYHYHGPSSCIPNAEKPNALIGYAIDGFGIYSKYDAQGNEYTDADLDACHGLTSTVTWNGQTKSIYHYVLTDEYPYTVGCFRGTPIKTKASGAATTSAQGNNSTQGGPPAAAIEACSGKSMNASCSVNTPQGAIQGTCKNTPDNTFACVPQ